MNRRDTVAFGGPRQPPPLPPLLLAAVAILLQTKSLNSFFFSTRPYSSFFFFFTQYCPSPHFLPSCFQSISMSLTGSTSRIPSFFQNQSSLSEIPSFSFQLSIISSLTSLVTNLQARSIEMLLHVDMSSPFHRSSLHLLIFSLFQGHNEPIVVVHSWREHRRTALPSRTRRHLRGRFKTGKTLFSL